MAGWIVKISETTPEHADFAIEDCLWDIRNYGAFKKISAGDDVFFWLGGGAPDGGLKGWGRVEDGLTPLTGDMRPARWVDADSGGYTHRFTFEPLASSPKWNPTWSELQDTLGKGLAASAPVSPLYDIVHVQLMRGLYIPGAARGVDLTFGTPKRPSPVDDLEPYRPSSGTDSRSVVKRAIAVRQGQPAFRKQLRAAYDETCAITGYRVPNALEAAHIDPYRGADNHHVQNGLLLRSDIHTLFDLHELTIDEDYRVALSPALRRTKYAHLHGRQIELPASDSDQPSAEALARHRADCGWYSTQ
ncbi:HNH endonuclease [Gordonia sp. PS3]|uniref:HNH endonuclease n=1 Tax=Gordonia sp. PS3 TaxID=3248841 RepID=UPI0035C00808